VTEPTRTPEELLATALESLSSDERQQVVTWLFGAMSGLRTGWLGKPDRDQLLQVLSPGTRSLRELFGRQTGSTVLSGEGYQVMPVRLPSDVHARLRTWSADHGFSMATVLRGLVTRFLETQEG
jgi:hypothetical protein